MHIGTNVLNYTYICNCDSMIIGTFGSSLYFVKKIDCNTRLVARSITKIMFQFNSSVLPFVTSSHVDEYWSFDFPLSQQIHYYCSISPHQTSQHFLLSHHIHPITTLHLYSNTYLLPAFLNPTTISEIEDEVTLQPVGRSVNLTISHITSFT
jgi:hypothetical protein